MSGDGYLLLTQASEQPEKKLQKIISGPITKMLPAIKINNQDEKRPGQTQINGPGKAQITKPQLLWKIIFMMIYRCFMTDIYDSSPFHLSKEHFLRHLLKL